MMFAPVNEQMDLIRKGTVDIIPEDELVMKLERSRKENKPLIVKLGADPSRPDLHIGHAVVLNKLRDFQNLGHIAVLIIGDATGMIGDPTGKKKTRPQLTWDETRENGKTYYDQASKILDKDKTKILYNSEWLNKLTLVDIINIMGKFTVQRIMERDDFESRWESEQEIAMHELLYPLMQGYDSYAIHADVELGGTDQRFNNLVGRDMQKRFGQEPQVVVVTPLLEGVDGSEKMSKSLDNAIGITDEPRDIFGKTMRIPDTLIHKYFQLGTQLPLEDLEAIRKELEHPDTNPRDHKRKLGMELVKLYYDEETAQKAIEEFDQIFIKKEVPDDIPEHKLNGGEVRLTQLMTDTRMTSSNSEARRLIEQGGVTIDGEKVSDVNYVVGKGEEFVLKVGKRKFLRVLSY
ncbi:MAG: tyrosine--tRNA ligase [Ignavibacteriae bacterium]|nr:tyrosine--tRNA ligase [Ignavibacteriota bacterium]MCB9243156.1 tyrosine--tRNA ligase [Ignavibacteriales bacterium]